ncbi:MAG: hypothetical protein EAZ08_00760 [Cytophagales bacterium]|nr:MAG: hypothetical protein EAZ08_00760 [Cytophagales bacterium]
MNICKFAKLKKAFIRQFESAFAFRNASKQGYILMVAYSKRFETVQRCTVNVVLYIREIQR